jgi:hypothetical protein
MRLWLIISTFVVAVFTADAALAGSRTILVSGDSGGSVVDYAMRAASYQAGGGRMQFSGRCDSACTLYLSLPAKSVCVGSGAYFRFHLPQSAAGAGQATRFMMRQYPGWVRHWIATNGGLSSRLITMKASYARHFLPTCPETLALR